MKKYNSGKSDKLNSIYKVLIFLLTFVILFFTLITVVVSPKYSVKVGEIAKNDIKAPREVKDRLATEEKYRQVEEQVEPQYTKDNEVKENIINTIDSLFIALRGVKSLLVEDEAKVEKLKEKSPILLSEEEYVGLVALQDNEVGTLQQYLVDIFEDIYDNSRIESKTEHTTRTQEELKNRFNSSNLSSNQKVLGISIGYKLIKPNYFFDEQKTEELKKEAIKDVEPVMIKKDQIIVKYGEPITVRQIQILTDLGLLNDNPAIQWRLYISLAVLLLGIMIFQWHYIYKFYRSVFDNNKIILLINLLSCVSVIISRAMGVISPYLIPFACIPLLMTLLVNYKISLVINILNVILISGSVGFNIEAVILAVFNTVIGAVVLRKMQARNDIFYSTAVIVLVNVVCTFCIGTLLSNNYLEVLKRAGLASVGSITAAVLTIGLLPFFEFTFDIVTAMKLLELANPNQPLLKRLLIEAPGTYHHSVMVANLAEVAAEDIGANSILARVGAYYHDVGKIKRPYFFKENQMGMDNPHDKIAPDLSAMIITSHVKDGLELAKEYKVPVVIQDIIAQHHGNSLVKYFYITMRNNAQNIEDVKEEDFRYAGPIPKAKETALVMLADSVEAAVRSIKEPSIEKIETMVNNIFKDKLNDGQLSGCDLTLYELKKVKKAFLKALTGLYHQRIEYPEENKIVKAEEIKNDLH
ncbi:HD family phosphohydrolase [Clostridium thermarum]|uniref:HD family phosphohydrolase n=1 Tax=Clostridium thermarum TaxID=1716543 RepID=UPI0013D723D7|nr:HD family phosphohydrolase [Clostridium thermarum]